jgi:hypothetical protein
MPSVRLVRDWGVISSPGKSDRAEDRCNTNPTYSKSIHVFCRTFARMCSYDGVDSDWTGSMGTML